MQETEARRRTRQTKEKKQEKQEKDIYGFLVSFQYLSRRCVEHPAESDCVQHEAVRSLLRHIQLHLHLHLRTTWTLERYTSLRNRTSLYRG